jgi:hypothetical protein
MVGVKCEGLETKVRLVTGLLFVYENSSMVRSHQAHVDFDWRSVEDDTEQFQAGLEQGRTEGLTLLRDLLDWADRHGKANKKGLRNRCIALVWLFSTRYRTFRQVDLRMRYGLRTKQIVHRELRSFKEAFPKHADTRFFSLVGRASLVRSYRERHPGRGGPAPAPPGTSGCNNKRKMTTGQLQAEVKAPPPPPPGGGKESFFLKNFSQGCALGTTCVSPASKQ